MTKPIRIQRKRTKGWRMPPNTVYVGRPTKWGNPYSPNDRDKAGLGPPTPDNMEMAARWFQNGVERLLAADPNALDELRGKNLACWCPLDQPCHADVLLELANQPQGEE